MYRRRHYLAMGSMPLAERSLCNTGTLQGSAIRVDFAVSKKGIRRNSEWVSTLDRLGGETLTRRERENCPATQ